MTSANSLHGEGHPKLVLWDNPGGWGGERGSFCRTGYNGLLTVILHTSLPPESANSTRGETVPPFASSHCIFVEHEPGGTVAWPLKKDLLNE